MYPESINDLTVFKTEWAEITNRIFLGDKIYYNVDSYKELELKNNAVMLTPVKSIKGQTIQEKQRNEATDDLFSRTVSSGRQQIEAFLTG